MKKQLAIVIAAVTVVLMGGAAFAVTGSPFTAPTTHSTPTLNPAIESSTSEDATETSSSSDTESSDTESSESEAPESDAPATHDSSSPTDNSDESTDSSEHPDNHGADVSSAAHDCPQEDHGECVSAVARDNHGQSDDHGKPNTGS